MTKRNIKNLRPPLFFRVPVCVPPDVGRVEPPEVGREYPPEVVRVVLPEVGRVAPPEVGRDVPPDVGRVVPPEVGRDVPPEVGRVVLPVLVVELEEDDDKLPLSFPKRFLSCPLLTHCCL